MSSGPMSYENWLLASSGQSGGLFEYQLYSDSRLHGRWSQPGCPYAIIEVLREVPDIPRAPAVLLRMKYCALALSEKNITPTYHGGSLQEEVAALASLVLGVRLKSGNNYSRRWGFDDDPLGQPVCTEEPLYVPTAAHRMVKRTLDHQSLSQLDLLATLPTLQPNNAVALVLASRLYQGAMWMADQDPAYAWLQLVSAVETAAGSWSKVNAPALDRMRISRPNLVNLLMEAGGVELTTRVAAEMADYMGATKKFLDFLLTFLPDPPSSRPALEQQIEWSISSLKKRLQKIYSFRSQALHSGVHFPLPLCQPANGNEETPTWVSTSNLDGQVWKAVDVPMLFHTFEYIVRGALLKWWQGLATAANTGKDTHGEAAAGLTIQQTVPGSASL